MFYNFNKSIRKVKAEVTSKLKNIINKLVDKNIINLFIDLYNYKNNKINIILFIIITPFTIIFLLLNLFFFLFFLFYYFFYFSYFFIKIKFYNKKNKKKIIKYKKRFRFLKNFHAIIIEKTIITFPRKKAFLVFYIVMKKIINRDKENIEKEIIKDWLRTISNRYIIIFFIGIPYIVLYCNNCFVKVINNLKDFEYENNYAYINTIILNLYKNLLPNYTKLVEKLKIIITKKNIIFNSYKEIIKATKNKFKFKENFSILKEETIYASVKHKIDNKKCTKNHPTIILKTEENEGKIIYLNETLSEKLKIWTFMKEIKERENPKKELKEKLIENNFTHEGSLIKRETFYTDPIESEIKKIVIKNPAKDNLLKNDLINENSNKALASLTISLNKNVIKTEKIKINGKEKNILLKEEIEKNFLTWIKENEGKLSNRSFEALMEINLFWEESENIIKNLSEENKIKLAEILEISIEEFNDPKEINFKIFINFLSKEIKN